MNKQLKLIMTIGFCYTIIVGSLLHFVYGWSNHNPIVASIAPINESTWEHLKLFFTPTLLFILCTGLSYSKRYTNYVTANVFSLYLGIISIVVIFYTYTGIIGKHYLVMDIITFILSTLIAYLTAYFIIIKKRIRFPMAINIILILLLVIIFITFTFYIPSINLFKTP